jgi:hypothetical protein
MPIRVDAYTSWGMASGLVARPGKLRDILEIEKELPIERAAWQPIDDKTPQAAGSVTIPSDDVLAAVGDEDPGIPVHATWHHIELDAGPYTIEGELATMPGFDPGRALTRPTGEFVLLRDVRLSVRARPEDGAAVGQHALINRYGVDRIKADLMLGFFFPGATIETLTPTGDVGTPQLSPGT